MFVKFMLYASTAQTDEFCLVCVSVRLIRVVLWAIVDKVFVVSYC